MLLTLLPEIFQPFAHYKTACRARLLVLAFLYLPAGIYGSLRRLAYRGLAMRAPSLKPLDLADVEG